MSVPTIAVVYSYPPFLSLLHEVLTDEGYRTLLLGFADAQGIASHSPAPDCIVLDEWIDAPEDGWGLLLRLRADDRTRDIPAILYANNTEPARDKALALRVTQCTILDKSFVIDDLLTVIETILGPSPVARQKRADDRVPQRIPFSPRYDTKYAAADETERAAANDNDGEESSANENGISAY